MKTFIEKNCYLVEYFKKPSIMDHSQTTYYIFKIEDEAYCMSFNVKSKVYIISDYDLKTNRVNKMYGYFSKTKAREFIEDKLIRAGKKVVH